MKKLIVCNFSGGRTSSFMARLILDYAKYKDYDKVFVYANTGKEDERTLEFIDNCDKAWGLGVVWLEAAVTQEKGVGTGFKVTSFEQAARNGEPFEEVIKKYKLPSVFGSVCTKELKAVPIRKYVKSLGYKEVYNAIGIRHDERHRISMHAEKNKIIYPLVNDIQVNASFIRNWWDKQPFDLQLKDYEGNCDLCFKKSLRKRLTILKENPDVAAWWINMENKYQTQIVPRFDVRNKLTTEEILEKSKGKFKQAVDKHELEKLSKDMFDDFMDYETDCFCKAN